MTYNSSKTGAQVDAAVDDVQEAKAASATDTTANRLLKVGDFGWNGRGAALKSAGSANDQTAGSVETWGGSVTDKPGGPDGIVSFRMSFTDVDLRGMQLATSINNEKFWCRSKTNSGWHPWRELYHTGNTIVDVNGFIKEA